MSKTESSDNIGRTLGQLILGAGLLLTGCDQSADANTPVRQATIESASSNEEQYPTPTPGTRFIVPLNE